MKTMTLTGLGSEQNFETEGTSYFLVFNNGELRVPISEKAAEVVVKEMYSGQGDSPEEDDSSSGGPIDDQEQLEDDDGVGQI